MQGLGRIIIDEKAETGKSYTLGKEGVNALAFWEARAGEAVTVSDAGDRLYRARLIDTGGKTGTRIYVFEEMGEAKNGPEITLLQALPEKERMELIIQKAAELGVNAIVPFKSQRSISLEERDSRQKKAHKWQDVARRASKQSRSEFIPLIHPYCPFADALDISKGASLKIALWERPGIRLIKDILSDSKKDRIGKAAILVGPEGGLEGEEMNLAIKAGFSPASLGRRILRTETAAIMAVGLLRYELAS